MWCLIKTPVIKSKELTIRQTHTAMLKATLKAQWYPRGGMSLSKRSLAPTNWPWILKMEHVKRCYFYFTIQLCLLTNLSGFYCSYSYGWEQVRFHYPFSDSDMSGVLERFIVKWDSSFSNAWSHGLYTSLYNDNFHKELEEIIFKKRINYASTS